MTILLNIFQYIWYLIRYFLMEDLNSFRNKLIQLKQDFHRLRVQIPFEAAITATSVVVQRVISTGLNSTGKLFGEYAPSTKKSKARKGHTESPYPNINFSDTNTMWRTTRPEVTRVTSSTVEMEIISNDSGRKLVMGMHNKRFGNITALSLKERETLFNDYVEEYSSLMSKHLN